MGCHFLLQCMKVKSESEVAHSCRTPSDPMDRSLPGSSVHGLFQAKVPESGTIALVYVYLCLYICTCISIAISVLWSVAQLCPTLCDHMNSSSPVSSVHLMLDRVSQASILVQEKILKCVAMPSSRGSSQPRIDPRCPALRADSSPAEPHRKPKNTGVGSLSLLQQIFPPTNQTGVSCIAGGFFTN